MSPYRVLAYNTAHASENKIHDDSVARRFGFTGALVPGVDVYAYMMHLPVERWGRAFLEHGAAECRFAAPVYDGEIAEIGGVAKGEQGEAIDIEVTSQGARCASGSAHLPAKSVAPSPDTFPAGQPPSPEDRKEASEATLPVGGLLHARPLPVDREYASNYLRDVRETDGLYAREGLVHPGIVLRLCNMALLQSVRMGPWIHVGSAVRNHGFAIVGQTLTANGRVVGNYERKGHRFVEFDALVLADGVTPVASVRHTAIYRPRQAAG